jgi:hypothetical protein
LDVLKPAILETDVHLSQLPQSLSEMKANVQFAPSSEALQVFAFLQIVYKAHGFNSGFKLTIRWGKKSLNTAVIVLPQDLELLLNAPKSNVA